MAAADVTFAGHRQASPVVSWRGPMLDVASEAVYRAEQADYDG
ncbi:hypothetical protein [Sphaerisporangium siamense]|uniref:Uncharacterized protein n=1 Tax=Sphaerisporangium siamense TaxID=795645 RepID=A0A7W7GAR6_9ACTN|nr:hypothetical protein [Sphaerisporangium siamense]MBB4700271.1 hypothetical protein [Sphaerisporangium siamense]